MTEAPNRIRELRMQAGLAQQALADRIGVSKPTISDLEKGNMQLTVDYMRRLARALDVTMADLLSASDNPDALSIEERRLIDQLRQAGPDQREQVLKVAEVLAPYRPADPGVDRLKPRKIA